MKISQKFTVARPLADVWAFFQDVPAVARCMPGAELTEDKGDGLFAGKVKVRLGPFGANFEGEAKVMADPVMHSGHVEGKGVDKRGGSRTRMIMDYRLAPAESGTEVTVDADLTLAGAIAQFGRTSLLRETANILVRDFAGALEMQLAPQAKDPLARNPSIQSAAKPRAETPPVAAARAEAVPITDQPQRAPQPPETAERPQAPESPAPEAAQTTPRQAPEPASIRKPVRAPKPAPHEISAGSVALRALWAWFKNLVRGLFSSDHKR